MERKGEEYGKLVETLQLSNFSVEKLQRNQKSLEETTNILVSRSGSKKLEQLTVIVVTIIFNQTSNLKSLIILDPRFNLSFHYDLGGKRVSPAFFSTLKTLHIRTTETFPNLPILARNVVWLMVFLPHLTTAFDFDTDDFSFLEEYSGYFDGLSNVKKLSLIFDFKFKTPDLAATRTRPLGQLLRVTNQLEKLEIGHSKPSMRTLGRVEAATGCFEALHDRSSQSLKEIRLLRIGPDTRNIPATDYSVFKSLRIMSGDVTCLVQLQRVGQDKLPPNLEVLHLPCYWAEGDKVEEHMFAEEDLLLQLVTSGKFFKLKEVVVPSQPINDAGKVTGSEAQRKLWRGIREQVERKEIFRNGKI